MSSYTIPVKLEDEGNKYMLIHGYTGAIDIVSGELLSMIKSPVKICFHEDLLNTLLKRGYITNKTKEEEHEYVSRIAKALTKKGNYLYSDFTWMVTYNCNFRCPYCFENRKKKDGTKKIVFTKEGVDAAYYAIKCIQPKGTLINKTMTLYGGEPLLAENYNIVSYIVEEGKKRGYKFVATTNGYEVDSYADLLAKDKICKLQITIDGMKEEHNKRRVHYEHKNTFDKIISNIQLALDKGIKVVVRMNVGQSNESQFGQVKQFFLEKGFYAYKKFDFYSSMITDNIYINDFDKKNLQLMSPEIFSKKITDNIDLFQLDDNTLYHNIVNAIQNKKPLHFRSTTCAAQTNGYVLDPIGQIYPCWEVVGISKHLEGHYTRQGITWNKPILSQWKEIDISQRKECYHCKYALLCGGGCPYHYLEGNNINCTIFKRVFHAIARKAYLMSNKIKTSTT